jgi:hypothetical protein
MATTAPADLDLPPLKDGEVGSIIAFLWRIRFDPTYQKAFKETGYANGKPIPIPDLPKDNPVVRPFKLTDRQKVLINELHDYEMGEDDKKKKWAELLGGATTDVYKWTYVEQSAW